MRTGKVFALTWDDIDLDNRIIKINKTVYAKDKEEKGRWYLGTTKTVGSQREVYICNTLYKILLDYKKIKDDYKKQYSKNYKKYVLEEVKNKYGKLVEYKIVESNSRHNKVDMVFTRKDGIYSGTDIVKYPFKIIHHELGIKCRFYDLRGSYATTILKNGTELRDVADILGHNNVETTENYYISSTNDSRKEATVIFDNVMNSDVINKIIKYEV